MNVARRILDLLRGFGSKMLVSTYLADGGLIGKTSGLIRSYAWILSSPAPQPITVVGSWDDGENWVDTNIWYD